MAERLRALDHVTTVSGVGSSPALEWPHVSQKSSSANVPVGFSRGSPVFAPPTGRPALYELK